MKTKGSSDIFDFNYLIIHLKHNVQRTRTMCTENGKIKAKLKFHFWSICYTSRIMCLQCIVLKHLLPKKKKKKYNEIKNNTFCIVIRVLIITIVHEQSAAIFYPGPPPPVESIPWTQWYRDGVCSGFSALTDDSESTPDTCYHGNERTQEQRRHCFAYVTVDYVNSSWTPSPKCVYPCLFRRVHINMCHRISLLKKYRMPIDNALR